VVGFCEYGDEPLDSVTMELVMISVNIGQYIKQRL
jgi:hypothetical protein